MTVYQPIMIDPASIVALNDARAGRRGRPKRGEIVTETVKRRSYNLSDAASIAVTEAAKSLGVTESAVVEAIAHALRESFAAQKNAG